MSAMYLVKDCSAGFKRTVKLVFTLHPHQFLLWIMFTSNKSDYSFRTRNCVMNQRKSNILGSLWYLLRLYRIWYYLHFILTIFHRNKRNPRYIIKIINSVFHYQIGNPMSDKCSFTVRRIKILLVSNDSLNLPLNRISHDLPFLHQVFRLSIGIFLYASSGLACKSRGLANGCSSPSVSIVLVAVVA